MTKALEDVIDEVAQLDAVTPDELRDHLAVAGVDIEATQARFAVFLAKKERELRATLPTRDVRWARFVAWARTATDELLRSEIARYETATVAYRDHKGEPREDLETLLFDLEETARGA